MHAVHARRRGYHGHPPGTRAGGARRQRPELRPHLGQRPQGLALSCALALRARQLWDEISADVPGIGFRPAGSLTIATSEAELRVLEEAVKLPDAARAGLRAAGRRRCPRGQPRAARRLPAAGCCAGPTRSPSRDWRWPRCAAGSSPRVPAMSGCPAARPSASEPRGVRDHVGAWHRGDLVVLCTGASLHRPRWPAPARLVGARVPVTGRAPACAASASRCCRPPPSTATLTTSVADGDSLRYYPAYDVPSRDALGPQPAVAAAARAQLLMVQRLDGGLTIGDTHEYDEPFTFDVDEDAYDHLRARAEALLGAPLPAPSAGGPASTARSSSPAPPAAAPCTTAREVAPGVVLVTGPGGRGMTCSPAIAEETFALSRMTQIRRASTWPAPPSATTAVGHDGLHATPSASEPARRRVQRGDEVRAAPRWASRRSRCSGTSCGDEAAAQRVNASFERTLRAAVAAGEITALPGAEHAVRRLPRRRDQGVPVDRLLPSHPGRDHRRARLGGPGRPRPVPRRRRAGAARGPTCR